MFEKNDKRRLYWLIEVYLRGEIKINTLDEEYQKVYIAKLDREKLSDLEHQKFSELYQAISRWSSFEEDHQKMPNFYHTEKELREMVIETKNALKYESPIYQLLSEVMEKLPAEDVTTIKNSIDSFDWFSAIETLCIQLYQNKVVVSKELYESISDFGDKVGVDPFICLLLKELVEEKSVKIND